MKRLLLLLAWGLVALGCESERAVMRMHPVPLPPGGAVFTLTTVESGASTKLIAPTNQAIFLSDGRDWEEVQPQLLPSYRMARLDPLRYPQREFTFPRERAFVGVGERVFLALQSSVSNHNRLWVSDDAGRTWSLMRLPEDEGDDLASDPIRLTTSDGVLYAIQARKVWRLEGMGDWTAVSLEGVSFDFDDAQPVPPVIRNFLPRSKTRDFDLVTVLSDQLRIYRREADGEWILISVLPDVDRQIVAIPASRTVLLSTTNSIFRSDDDGEQWIPYWPPNGPEIEVVKVFRTPNGHSVFVGCIDGSIWRTTISATGWEAVREADPDARGISGFAYVGKTLYASTLGQGVIRSTDHGANWADWSDSLRASFPLDADLVDGRFTVATEAGVYHLAGGPKQGRWNKLHDRATGAMAMSGKTLISGTFSGEIMALDGAKSTKTLPMVEESSATFTPQRHGETWLPRTTVADISIDNDTWSVWTRHRGFYVSTDAGENWREVEISDALLRTLRASTITRFISGGLDTIYIAEHSERLGTPTQLWRSQDLGASWTAVHSFPKSKSGDERVIIKRTSREDLSALAAADWEGLMLSKDGGASWSDMSGPWVGAIDFTMNEKRINVLGVSLVGTSTLYVIPDIDEPAKIRDFDLLWPEGATDPPHTLEMLSIGRDVYITTPQGIYYGQTPIGTGRYGEGFVGILAFAVVAFASALGFALLRIYGK